MAVSHSWLLVTGLVVSLACTPGLRPVHGDEPAETAIPFVVFSVASVDRTLTDIAWMFESVNRKDMLDVLGGLLGQAGDLKGIDRTKPFGQVVFLQTDALPPRPAFVFFAPIENLEDLLKTIARAPVAPQPVTGRKDQYDIYSPDLNRTVATLRVIGNYAYAVPTEFADILDVLPDMRTLADQLAARYDVALTVQVKAIPKGVREVFVNFLRTQAEIDLQRRDDEDEAEYLVRRANGLNGLELIEQVVLDGEDLTLGWNAEPEKRSGYFEGTLNAAPDSPFAKFLSEVGGKASMFTPLREEDRPLTVNISWVMNQREQKALSGLLQAAKVKLSQELPDLAREGGPIEQMHNSLQATIDNGHFDLFFQFAAPDVQEFVFLGGLKLAGAQAFGQALEQFLQGVIVRIQDLAQSNPSAVGDAPQILPNAESHQGVTFHKIVPKQVPSNEQRLYGGTPDVYVGVSSRALWWAVGRDEALPTLKASLDALLTAPPLEREAGGNVPLSVTVRVAPWLELPQPPPSEEDFNTGDDREDRRTRRLRQRMQQRREITRELAQEAFTPSDKIRIEGRPLESGFRVRVHLDEGFIKLLGLSIAREYDRSQL